MSITNESIREYIEANLPERDEELQRLHDEATSNDVPIIKHEMERLLALMIKLHKPKKVLEIGTAVAYSSIIMTMAAEGVIDITTLEKSKPMIEQANRNIQTFGYKDCIHIIEGDASMSLDALKGSKYDMIFIDAAKGQYMTYYEKSLPMLKVGGLLIADNVLQEGLIAKSRFAIPRRQRTIHGRMRNFIKTVNENKNLQTSVLPMADGATISLKLR